MYERYKKDIARFIGGKNDCVCDFGNLRRENGIKRNFSENFKKLRKSVETLLRLAQFFDRMLFSDKIRKYGLFARGRFYAELFRRFFAVQKIRHVFAEDAHCIHAFGVFFRLLRICAVHEISISRRDDRHFVQAEIFVELIVSGGSSRAASR